MKKENQAVTIGMAVGALGMATDNKALGLGALSVTFLYKLHEMGARQKKLKNMTTSVKARCKDKASSYGLTKSTGAADRVEQVAENIATGASTLVTDVETVIDKAATKLHMD